MMIKKLQYFYLSLLILPFCVSAAEIDLFNLSFEELMKLQVVTAASGFEQNIKHAPSSVTIIEASEWQARGAKSLTQALQGAPSVEVNSVANGNSFPKYTIRGLSGIYGQQVVILIDGIPVNRLYSGGGPTLTELPLQGYKRIEIIRSPGSVVYGADAFGGIINLVSYGIDEQPNEVTVTAGEFDTLTIGANGSFNINDIKFQLSANYQTFGDDPNRRITNDLQTMLDSTFNTTASNAPGSLNNSYESFAVKGKIEWQALSFVYNGISGETGFGSGAAQALDPKGYGDYQHHLVGIDYDLSSLIQNTALSGELMISAWYNYEEGTNFFTILPMHAVLPIGSDGNLNFTDPTTLTTFTEGYIGQPSNKTKRYHLSLKHLFVVADVHQLRWEVGFEEQEIKTTEKKNFGPIVLDGTETIVDGSLTDITNTPYVFMPNKQRDFIFASLQDEWQLSETLLLNVGARFDDYSDVGSTFNPRVGLNWSASEKFTIRLFSGSAFRAPSFADLYAQNNPASAGNIEVKPEKITTYELGGEYQFADNLRSAITVFSYRADSLIDYVLDATSGGKKAENVGEQQALGFEWELHWRPHKSVDISSNYSYSDSNDGKNNSTTDIAKQLAAFVINWQPTDNINMNLASNWVMDRDRPKTDTRAALKDYTLVTSKVSYAGLINDLDISVSINNLLAEDIRHPSNGTITDDFPQAGRQWLAEVVYHF